MSMKRFLYEVYFALKNIKLLHFERFYMITYDTDLRKFNIYTVDGYGVAHRFKECDDKMTLSFVWRVLMGRDEVPCLS